MNFRFGEWYTTLNNENSQVYGYEVLSLPLSYLYLMLVAVEKGSLVLLPISEGFTVNIVEHMIVNRELETAGAEKKSSANEIELARRKLGDLINSFHESILKYDDMLTKREDELDGKS